MKVKTGVFLVLVEETVIMHVITFPATFGDFLGSTDIISPRFIACGLQNLTIPWLLGKHRYNHKKQLIQEK